MIRNPILWITVLLQVAGPYFFGFGNWANVLQYLGGFGIPLAVVHFYSRHRREMEQLKFHLLHLHTRHDDLMKEVRKQ